MLNLQDFTFIIPFKSQRDRKRNLLISLNYLLTNCKTKVLIVDRSQNSLASFLAQLPYIASIQYIHLPNKDSFNKSQSLNIGARISKTPYISLWDADTLIPLKQIKEAANLIRSREASFIIPYKNRVMFLPDKFVVRLKNKSIMQKDFPKLDFQTSDYGYFYVGGINFIHKQDFIKIGMMNEKLKGFGYEDMEVYMRYLKLGYNVLSLDGLYYHLNHFRPHDYRDHVFFENNKKNITRSYP